MTTRLEQREKVVQMYYYEHLSKAEICRRQSCPPVRTIHRWLVEAGLVESKPVSVEKRESKPIPFSTANGVAVIRDRYSRRCAIDALSDREAQGITNFLVNSWQWLGLPSYLQMDNALEFRGSNRYPRSFGRVVRVAVDLGMEPVFNPPGEPWRNGCVERHNGFLQDCLFTMEHADLTALLQHAQDCQTACNQTHRLAALEGLTPDEIAAKAILRFPPPGYGRYQVRSLPQDKGFVSFVRLVRKSGRITLGAGDRFMVDPELAYTYVLARVDLAQKTVTISQDDTVIKTYDYSPDTVGIWAEDEKDKVAKT